MIRNRKRLALRRRLSRKLKACSRGKSIKEQKKDKLAMTDIKIRSAAAALILSLLAAACATPSNCPAGRLTLRLDISEKGEVTHAEIAKSSGYPALDNAAIESAKKWRYAPARKNGVPVATTMLQGIKFTLRDDRSGQCKPPDTQSAAP